MVASKSFFMMMVLQQKAFCSVSTLQVNESKIIQIDARRNVSVTSRQEQKRQRHFLPQRSIGEDTYFEFARTLLSLLGVRQTCASFIFCSFQKPPRTLSE